MTVPPHMSVKAHEAAVIQGDRANLLYRLREHAGIEAKITPPDNWHDPAADSA